MDRLFASLQMSAARRARIRDVEQGPDGLVYVLTDEDDGNVWRLAPLR